MLTKYQTCQDNRTNIIDKKAQAEPCRVESSFTVYFFGIRQSTLAVHVFV